ncbi:Anthranilate phosphoribosyltransferase [Streptomyces badius]
MSTATKNPSAAEPAGARKAPAGERVADWADGRLGIYGLAKANMRKIFPDHWSFMLGEVALYSFIIIILTGVYLTLFFQPSMGEIVYHGPYEPMQGIRMSEAYASTLKISFEVRGGLLVRQIHHWAALIFLAAMFVHMMRVFFTGAFRKPREINWLFGFLLFVLGMFTGFTGYSLPDDLLSGTGVRFTQGAILSVPIVGTYISMFLFGGEFPGHDFVARFYSIHILLLPGIMLGLLVAHLILVFYHKHTQFAGPGRTNKNVVGMPLLPVYMAKAGGFFFLVFGIIAIISAIATINPIRALLRERLLRRPGSSASTWTDLARVVEVAEQAGITFCFAVKFHPALRYAAKARKELGAQTTFNILGPLTNPAQVRSQAVGVADARMAPIVAGVLADRGNSALVFRGDDGLDELTTTATSRVWVVRDGAVREEAFDPRDVGLPIVPVEALRGADASYNADVARRLLDGEEGAVREAVLLNSAAALVALDAGPGTLTEQLAAKIAVAAESIDSGAAKRALERWVAASNA